MTERIQCMKALYNADTMPIHSIILMPIPFSNPLKKLISSFSFIFYFPFRFVFTCCSDYIV